MTRSMIAILDLGSTQNARIAREVRALGVYSEIFAHDTDPAALKQVQGLAGIIVNGGENNIVDGEKIDVRPGVYELGLPVLTVAHEGAHPSDLPAWPDDSKPVLDKFIASTGCERNWNMQNFIDAEVELLRRQIAASEGRRRPTDLRAREPRPAQKGRAGAGHPRIPRADGREPHLCGRGRPLSR